MRSNWIYNMAFDEPDLLRRAFAAWYRTGGTAQPASTSDVRTVDGLTYVRVLGSDGILAVYRVQTSDRLKRLKRFPRALEPN